MSSKIRNLRIKYNNKKLREEKRRTWSTRVNQSLVDSQCSGGPQQGTIKIHMDRLPYIHIPSCKQILWICVVFGCITLHVQKTYWLITPALTLWVCLQHWITYLRWQAAVCWSAQSPDCAKALVLWGTLMAGTGRNLDLTGLTAAVGNTWDCWKTVLHTHNHEVPKHTFERQTDV